MLAVTGLGQAYQLLVALSAGLILMLAGLIKMASEIGAVRSDGDPIRRLLTRDFGLALGEVAAGGLLLSGQQATVAVVCGAVLFSGLAASQVAMRGRACGCLGRQVGLRASFVGAIENGAVGLALLSAAFVPAGPAESATKRTLTILVALLACGLFWLIHYGTTVAEELANPKEVGA